MNAGEEVVGKQGLEAELDAEVLVFFFGIGHAADDEHGEAGLELAEAGDELRAGHPGHDVVCKDEINGLREVVAAELLKCALRAQDRDDEVAGTLENGLPGSRLHSIIVDEQDGRGHSFLAVMK